MTQQGKSFQCHAGDWGLISLWGAKLLCSQKRHKRNKTNMYLERRIKVIYYSKQVIQCCQCSFCYLLSEWITVKHIFIGRIYCVSQIGMVPQQNRTLHKIHYLMVWFGFFVSWHINLCRLFNAKSILLEEQ